MGASVYIGDIYDSSEYIIVRYIRYDGGGEKECYLSINENDYKISIICFWRNILFPDYNYESWSSFRFSNNNMIINIRTKENGKNQRKFACRHINGFFDCDDDNFYAYIENNENF
ncbi:MAG: hypothetical protein IAE99_13130 [Rhodothermales bacterium]|nr:hypothetical protein [Rhodothermales bacterium]